MLFFGLLILLLVSVENGLSLECYSSEGNVVDDRDHEQTLPTESCKGRCYIRSNQNTQQVIMRGCTDNLLDLPHTGCYIFPTNTWCLCEEDLCNFGPMGWGEYNAPHVRMAREIHTQEIRGRNYLQHTLTDPFKEEPDLLKESAKRDPEIDRYRAVENLGVGLIKSDVHAEGKFAISNGELATDWPKVSQRMGDVPKGQNNSGKYLLHHSPQSRTKRKQKHYGSIFTKDGRIVQNNDYWTDDWSKPSQHDWQTSRRYEQKQTTRPRQSNNYDRTSPTSQIWGQDNRVYERNTNSYSLNERTRYPDKRYNHEDRALHDQHGQRNTQARQMDRVHNEELESWEAEGPVEIDDSFWDFSALIESSEKKSDSVFTSNYDRNTAKAPNYRRTTKRAWSPQTTTPAGREWNYRATTQNLVLTTDQEQGKQLSESVKPPSLQTQTKVVPVPSLIGRVQVTHENENSIKSEVDKPESSAAAKKTFTKGFFYKNPGEKEEIEVTEATNKPKSTTSQATQTFPKTTTKKPIDTTTLSTTEKTTPSTTQTEPPTTTVPTTEATTVTTTTTTTTQRTTTTLATTTTPAKTTAKYRKLAKAERHKSALPKEHTSGKKENEIEVHENCGSYAGRKSGKGCRNQPLRIFSHDTQTSRKGLTATTLKSVLQTALHLNISTLPVRGNDTRVNSSWGLGQSDGFTGLSISKRPEALIILVYFLPLLLRLFNGFRVYL